MKAIFYFPNYNHSFPGIYCSQNISLGYPDMALDVSNPAVNAPSIQQLNSILDPIPCKVDVVEPSAICFDSVLRTITEYKSVKI